MLLGAMARTNHRILTLALVAASFAMATPGVAATDQPVDLPSQQWLQLPDRREIPWDVKFIPARLTYEQRQMVELRVQLSGSTLQREGLHRDLHLLVKAGTGDGQWFDGYSYTHVEFTQKVNKEHDTQYVVRMYVSPGRYLIAVMLYDSVLNRRNLLRQWIDVQALKNDPLPQMERDLPPLQFLNAGGGGGMTQEDGGLTRRFPDFDASGFPRERLPHRGRRGSLSEDDLERTASLNSAGPFLLEPQDIKRRVPVATPRPIQIDVLINFSPSAQYTGMTGEYRRTADVFWQVAQVLSQLDVAQGCVRLTGIDVLGRKVLFEQVDARHMDWHQAATAIAGINADTVDVASLQGRRQTAAFFREAVERLLLRSQPGCGATPPTSRPLHVYVIAASGMVFPSGTHREPVGMVAEANRRVYYLRGALSRRNHWDEMENIVEPLRPRLLDFEDPLHFRKALATIVSDLQSKSDAQPAAGR